MAHHETVKIRALKTFSSTRYGNLAQGKTYHVAPNMAEMWTDAGMVETLGAPANKMAPVKKTETKPAPVVAKETKTSDKEKTTTAKKGAAHGHGHANRGKGAAKGN